MSSTSSCPTGSTTATPPTTPADRPRPARHGFDPAGKGFYHGGDLAGRPASCLSRRPWRERYLDDPQFTNRWVQDDGTGGSAPGTTATGRPTTPRSTPTSAPTPRCRQLVSAAHALGHRHLLRHRRQPHRRRDHLHRRARTTTSRSPTPYRDATGAPFDDRDYAGTGEFPTLDADGPASRTRRRSTRRDERKSPAWLNDPTLYHNRGDTTFAGENTLYGDFFGLDDLFTEHPEVETGMIEVFEPWVDRGIDGFRIDTVKHVNDEFWQQWAPAIEVRASSRARTTSSCSARSSAPTRSCCRVHDQRRPVGPRLRLPGRRHALRRPQRSAADDLRDFFAADDYYTDADRTPTSCRRSSATTTWAGSAASSPTQHGRRRRRELARDRSPTR